MRIMADDLLVNQREIRPGDWVVAKPCIPCLKTRLSYILDIITGKALAVYFYEDTIEDL